MPARRTEPQTINSMIARSESLLQQRVQRQRRAAGRGPAGAGVLPPHRRRSGPGRAESWAASWRLLQSSDDSALRAEASCRHGFRAVDARRRRGRDAPDRGDAAPIAPHRRRWPAICHQHMAFVAENRADGATAQRHAEAGLDAAEGRRSALRSSRLRCSAISPSPSSFRAATTAAGRLYARRSPRLTASGPRPLRHLRVEHPEQLGHRQPATRATSSSGLALVRAVGAARLRDRDPERPLPTYLSGNLARALELMGRYGEALTLYEQATADSVKSNRLDSRLFGLLGSASIALRPRRRRAGEPRARRSARRHEGPGSGRQPADARCRHGARQDRLAGGRLDDASAIFSSALAGHAASKQPNGSIVMLHLYRSETALRSKRIDDALRDAQQALDMARGLQGGIAFSSRTGSELARRRRSARPARSACGSAGRAVDRDRAPQERVGRRAPRDAGRRSCCRAVSRGPETRERRESARPRPVRIDCFRPATRP